MRLGSGCEVGGGRLFWGEQRVISNLHKNSRKRNKKVLYFMRSNESISVEYFFNIYIEIA